MNAEYFRVCSWEAAIVWLIYKSVTSSHSSLVSGLSCISQTIVTALTTNLQHFFPGSAAHASVLPGPASSVQWRGSAARAVLWGRPSWSMHSHVNQSQCYWICILIFREELTGSSMPPHVILHWRKQWKLGIKSWLMSIHLLSINVHKVCLLYNDMDSRYRTLFFHIDMYTVSVQVGR